MWGLFHELRVSEPFISEWALFLEESIRSVANPAFFQYVSYEIFTALIKREFEVSSTSETTTTPMTSDDLSALRYVAGYVCRKVREKLESSSVPQKNDMIITLMEFRGSGMHSQHECEEWTNSIDRGGLWHVSDDVFTFFCYMEEEIRCYFTKSNP